MIAAASLKYDSHRTRYRPWGAQGDHHGCSNARTSMVYHGAVKSSWGRVGQASPGGPTWGARQTLRERTVGFAGRGNCGEMGTWERRHGALTAPLMSNASKLRPPSANCSTLNPTVGTISREVACGSALFTRHVGGAVWGGQPYPTQIRHVSTGRFYRRRRDPVPRSLPPALPRP